MLHPVITVVVIFVDGLGGIEYSQSLLNINGNLNKQATRKQTKKYLALIVLIVGRHK